MVISPHSAQAGIGFKAQHGDDILAMLPPLAFLEVHAENYMGAGGPPHRRLSALREHYPLSVHGVGLSLGSAQDLDEEHLERLAHVVERYQPALVSEHLAWNVLDGIYLNDLVPLPYTEESLALVAGHVDKMQERLGRQVLIENPAAYVAFADSVLGEADFLSELSKRTGCGLLLDVNNLYVSATNLGFDTDDFLNALPQEAIGEIHLAGHLRRLIGRDEFLIDDHGSPVCSQVWQLYRQAIQRFGERPTLIEWDNDIPALPVLLAEAERASQAAASAIDRERAA
jgi:uncharacterized protein (UPF0276 family)